MEDIHGNQPVNTGKEQARGKFPAGQSGNPSGRKKGSRNKTTLAVLALLEGESEAISRKAIELAKSGDMTAIKLILERILPARKELPVSLELPVVKSASDAVAAMSVILDAVADATITPSEGKSLTDLVTHFAKILEVSELENRIVTLENASRK